MSFSLLGPGDIESDDDSAPENAEEHAPEEPPQKKAKKAKKKAGPRYLADLGTLYGFLQQASVNDERAFVASHEGKTFFAKLLAEAPGYDAQALNKLYDRDEVCRTCLCPVFVLVG